MTGAGEFRRDWLQNWETYADRIGMVLHGHGAERRAVCDIHGGKNDKPSSVIVVCEGYATGASLHEAVGHAVAVAFDSGNLLAVALAIAAVRAFAEQVGATHA